MKRSTILLTALGVLLYLGAVPLLAQGHGGGGGHSAGATVGHGPSTTPHGNKDIAGGGKSTETSSKTQLNEVIASSSSTSPSKLAQKLMNLLGVTSLSGPPNTTFKSLGRLVSAAHVYKNLDIASSKLCTGLTGAACWTKFATAAQNKSLGAAIKQFDPAADPKTETRNATKQANQDIKESESES